MPVIIQNLICLAGASLLAAKAPTAGAWFIRAVFAVFCLGHLPVSELLYRRMKFRRMLGFESVYLMTNFFIALIFRLVLRACMENEKAALACFMFFILFGAAHWTYSIIRLCIKRKIEGPPPKNPEDMRYGLIRDEDVKNEM